MDILSHIYEIYFNGCDASPTQTLLSECINRSTMLAEERLHRNMSDVAAGEGLKRYQAWLSSIGAPNTFSYLSDIDFDEAGFTVVAEHALSIYGGRVGLLYPLTSRDDIVELLKQGLNAY